MKNMISLLNNIITLAEKAGKETLKFYDLGFTVDYKSDDSPLTQADLASNAIIMKGLQELTPEIPVISEESGIASWEERKDWQKFWLVDPLDGTKEFVKKNGEFTINIALIESGKPVLGVIYVPVKEWFYYALKGMGSFKRIAGNETRIRSKKITIDEPLAVVESRSHPSAELEEFLTKIKIKERVKVGSSLKICLVAEGRADIYPRLSPTMEWDVAAGDAIFRYSGEDRELESGIIYNKPELRNYNFIIANTDDDISVAFSDEGEE